MNKEKMKYKIFFIMMLLVISLNNVSGYEVYEGEIDSIISDEVEKITSSTSSTQRTMQDIFIKEGSLADTVFSTSCMLDIEAWGGGLEYSYKKSDVIYKQGETEVGTGYVYYWMQNTDSIPGYDYVYIKCYFDEGLNIPSGPQKVSIEGDIISSIIYDRHNLYHDAHSMEEKQMLIGSAGSGIEVYTIQGKHVTKSINTFYNKYYYWYDDTDENLFNFNLTRNEGNQSKLLINNSYVELINETDYNYETINIYSDDIINHTWDIEIYDTNSITHSFQIDFIPEEEDLIPTLTTDKSLYNASELLTISYTNIDEMNIHGTPTLFIVYPIIDDYHDYDAKFMQHLLSSKEDETFTINTSILQPQTEYYLVIADNTDWSRIESAYITSDVFYVYPDEEYLTTSCTVEGNCYGGNGGYLSIYYKINNNSDIIIKDDEGNTIQTYYNIIDEGEINYHVPFDENKLNSYPNWKIYLNNTEYSTSYNTDVTVYWSLFAEPTPTPVYTIDIPDENVTEQIDQLKEESKPIFDLIYGLTTLVIDNPDYDNDNIIDEHEINNWFNSLIPFGILLLLVVLYMGLKKRD